MTELDFLADLDASGSPQAPRCTVRAVLSDLDAGNPDLAAQLRTALGSPRYRHSDISAHLRRRGVNLGPDTISRHRRGLCRCER